MRGQVFVILLIVLLLVGSTGPVDANSTPQLIKIQGFLSDTSGPREDPVTMLFALCQSLGGFDCGDPIAPTSGTVDPEGGIYSVELAFDFSEFDGPDRFLEITIDGEVLLPRVRVVSAPYAYVADTLDGFEGTQLDQAADVVILQGQVASTNDDLVAHEAGSDSHSAYVRKAGDSMTGPLGIGEPSPDTMLHLSDPTDAPEIRLNGESTMTTGEIWGPISLYQSGSTFLGQTYWKGQGTGIPDWHVDTRQIPGAFIVDGATGSVGIGVGTDTNTIATRLEVASGTDPMLLVRTTDTNGDDAGILIKGARSTSTTADVAYLSLQNFDSDEGGGEDFNMARIAGGMASESGKRGVLKFKTNNGTGLFEHFRIDADGMVGIGTTSPSVKLHVAGGTDASATGTGGYALFGSSTGTHIVVDNNEIMARDNGATSTLHLNYEGGDTIIGGNLGIGVDPHLTFEVAGPSLFFDEVNFTNGTEPTLILDNANPLPGGGGRIQVFSGESKRTVLIDGDYSSTNGLMGSVRLYDNTGTSTRVKIDAQEFGSSTQGAAITLYNGAGTETIKLDADAGSVGRITTNELTVSSDALFQGDTVFSHDLSFYSGGTTTMILEGSNPSPNGGARIQIYNENGKRTVLMDGDYPSTSGDMASIRMFENGTENVRVKIDAQEAGGPEQGAAIKLYNNLNDLTIELDADYGTGNEGRVITEVLQITGGSDLSEHFDIRDTGVEIEPGMVVSIDPKSAGELAVSQEPYDRRVAGVIAGAGGVQPGLVMGQRGTLADGEHPVALTGRVYCWADASYGTIKPGDLLTTSATTGHAMKVTDHDLAPGAILGKAMTGLSEGRGQVLVLVALQ